MHPSHDHRDDDTPERAESWVDGAAPFALARVVVEYLVGALSPELALAHLLLAHPDVADVAEIVTRVAARGAALDPGCAELHGRVAALRASLADHRAGCEHVAVLVRRHAAHEADAGDASVDAAIARSRALFDGTVAQNEEASVVLSSLGSPALLAAETRAVVALLAAWGVLGPARDVLQIGCGIGRLEAALAERVREAWGIDVSPGMIAAARRRCAGLANVRVDECSGRDLAAFPAARFDLVYAVDSFPYLVHAGMALVDTHLAEARRVLRPGGDLVIMGFSYRDTPDRDRRDVRALAAAHGFIVAVDGAAPGSRWDGVAFHCRRAPAP